MNNFFSIAKTWEGSIALNTIGASCKPENRWDTIAILELAQILIF